MLAAKDEHAVSECDQVRKYTLGPQLPPLPFPWYPEAEQRSKCTLLEALNLHNKEVFRHECLCSEKEGTPYGAKAPFLRELLDLFKGDESRSFLYRDELAEMLKNWWALPEASKLLTTSLKEGTEPPNDWKSYCKARDIPLSSPLPILLDGPLTIYSAILKFKKRCKGKLPPVVVIFVLGAEKEIDQWPVFLELGSLVPDTVISLHFIGPEVPSWADGKFLAVAPPGDKEQKSDIIQEKKPKQILTPDEEKAKTAAMAEKDKGNEYYKQLDFTTAIEYYTKAIICFDEEPSFYTNRAAAHYELGDYQACVDDCETALALELLEKGGLDALNPAKFKHLEREGPLSAVQMSFHQSYVQDIIRSSISTGAASEPDIVVGLNAGLAAYVSWREGLMALRIHMQHSNKPEVVQFTDYAGWSLDISMTHCYSIFGPFLKKNCGFEPPSGTQTLGYMAVEKDLSSQLKMSSTVEVNPFRKPIWVRNPGNMYDMPYCPNGFVFTIELD